MGGSLSTVDAGICWQNLQLSDPFIVVSLIVLLGLVDIYQLHPKKNLLLLPQNNRGRQKCVWATTLWFLVRAQSSKTRLSFWFRTNKEKTLCSYVIAYFINWIFVLECSLLSALFDPLVVLTNLLKSSQLIILCKSIFSVSSAATWPEFWTSPAPMRGMGNACTLAGWYWAWSWW